MNLIEKISLENGLVAEIYDCSRILAGDRWLVSLLCRVEIPLIDEVFKLKKEWEELKEPFIEEFGEKIFYELKKERIFIDQREKDEIFNELLNQLKNHSIKYMGHKRFALGHLKRQVEEFDKRRKWW